MSAIYVIHENDAWVEPLRAAFAARSLPYDEWFLDKGVLDFSSPPPARTTTAQPRSARESMAWIP
jgi:hypothetical protein